MTRSRRICCCCCSNPSKQNQNDLPVPDDTPLPSECRISTIFEPMEHAVNPINGERLPSIVVSCPSAASSVNLWTDKEDQSQRIRTPYEMEIFHEEVLNMVNEVRLEAGLLPAMIKSNGDLDSPSTSGQENGAANVVANSGQENGNARQNGTAKRSRNGCTTVAQKQHKPGEQGSLRYAIANIPQNVVDAVSSAYIWCASTILNFLDTIAP